MYDAAKQVSRVVHESLETHSVHRVPGLRAQLIDAAGSIAANTSEGASRGSASKFLNHLRIALGSANETRTHLQRAKDEAKLPMKLYFACDAKALVTAKMLASLIRRIEEDEARRDNDNQA
ncbi:four helix bundle protein [Gemmatimonas sp.]|uniref:four helix bundle protein n=1 Tax=Gemmatimonas sp. TaxID=1962908 RepID=UPI00286CA33A|nr:four helix bundle protein [Gemmatimonas sp.]